MKIPALLLFLLILRFSCLGQEAPPKEELRNTIETFFRGFHKQDSVMMRSVVHNEVSMQSIGADETGNTILHQVDFENFIKSIVSIPDSSAFREEIHSYDIKVDGDMANVWTPYSFYFNGEFSHCGVNSFQLIQVKDQWKIFFLVDTRRRTGCEKN